MYNNLIFRYIQKHTIGSSCSLLFILFLIIKYIILVIILVIQFCFCTFDIVIVLNKGYQVDAIRDIFYIHFFTEMVALYQNN